MFINKLKFLHFYFIFFFTSIVIQAQTKKDTSQLTYIDSVYNVNYRKYSTESQIVIQKLLKESVKLSYNKGILKGYSALLLYYGYSQDKHLDSVLHYADLYESKIAFEKERNNTQLIDSVMIYLHYLNKGQLLANEFGLTDQGLQSYFKAYPTIPKDNLEMLTNFDISISYIYLIKGEENKGIEVLNLRLKDTSKITDLAKINLFRAMASSYAKKDMPEESYSLNKKALKLAKKKKYKRHVLWIKNEIIYDLYKFGDYQKAIDSALVIRADCIKTNFHEPLFNNNLYLSDNYHALGYLDKAITYREEALEHPYSIQEKRNIYDKLANFYNEKKQYQKAIDLYKKKDKVVDSLRAMEVSSLTNYIDSNAKLLLEQQNSKQTHFDIELLEEKNKKQKLYLFCFGIALITIILFLLSIFLFKKNRTLFKKYRKGEMEIEVLKINEKKLLEEKIILRENELEASSFTLSQRLCVLTSIKNELNEINTPYTPKLDNIKNKVTDLIKSASDISIITDRTESEYPTITKEIKNKYFNLTDTEIRYCLLTILNLSIKETAIILNVTPNTVKVARSRIKKKMNIPSKISFKVFLNESFQL